MSDDRRDRLAALLATFEEALDWEFDPEEFDDRLRIQKYVFLADAFGVDHDYGYGIHLYGPYSPTLADDYYAPDFEARREGTSPMDEFDTSEFRALVAGRDTKWLEAAGTIKSLHERHADIGQTGVLDTVVARVVDLKDVDIETAEEIYDELLDADVI